MEVTAEVTIQGKCPCCSLVVEVTGEATVEVEPEDLRADRG